MTDPECESISLEQLNGAVLVYEDSDGNKQRVEFDE